MVVVAEDRRVAVRRLVGPDALEDAGPVVQGVREYVNLGVLERDELPVHPDAVSLAHFNSSRTASVVSAVVAVPPRSVVRSPPARARSTADSTAAACVLPGESVPEHHRRREDHGQRVGDALARDVGRGAVDGLEHAGLAGLPEAARWAASRSSR